MPPTDMASVPVDPDLSPENGVYSPISAPKLFREKLCSSIHAYTHEATITF